MRFHIRTMLTRTRLTYEASRTQKLFECMVTNTTGAWSNLRHNSRLPVFSEIVLIMLLASSQFAVQAISYANADAYFCSMVV